MIQILFFQSTTKINNLFGFQGSFTSDLLFQAFGVISYLIPLTLIFTGTNIFKLKQIFFSVENIFFWNTLYYIWLNLFLTYSTMKHLNSTLMVMVDFEFLSNSFLGKIFLIYKNISFYILIFLFFHFLLSINFKLNCFYKALKKFIYIFSQKNIILKS